MSHEIRGCGKAGCGHQQMVIKIENGVPVAVSLVFFGSQYVFERNVNKTTKVKGKKK